VRDGSRSRSIIAIQRALTTPRLLRKVTRFLSACDKSRHADRSPAESRAKLVTCVSYTRAHAPRDSECSLRSYFRSSSAKRQGFFWPRLRLKEMISGLFSMIAAAGLRDGSSGSRSRGNHRRHRRGSKCFRRPRFGLVSSRIILRRLSRRRSR